MIFNPTLPRSTLSVLAGALDRCPVGTRYITKMFAGRSWTDTTERDLINFILGGRS